MTASATDGRRNNRPPVSPGRPPGAAPPAGMRAFQGILRKQIEIYRQAQAELLESTLARKAKDPTSTPTAAEVTTRQEITEFLFRTSPTLIKLAEALNRALSGLPIEQLEAQVRAEFVRQVLLFSDEEWDYFNEERRKMMACR